MRTRATIIAAAIGGAVCLLALAGPAAAASPRPNDDVLVETPDGPVPLRYFLVAAGKMRREGEPILHRPKGPVPLGGEMEWNPHIFPIRSRRISHPGRPQSTLAEALEKADPEHWQKQNTPRSPWEFDVWGNSLRNMQHVLHLVAHAPRGEQWPDQRDKALEILRRFRGSEEARAEMRRQWQPYHEGRLCLQGHFQAVVAGTVDRLETAPPWTWARLRIPKTGDLPASAALLVGGSSGPCRLRRGRVLVGGLIVGRWDPDGDGQREAVPAVLAVLVAADAAKQAEGNGD